MAQIKTKFIENLAITTAKLNNLAVDSTKLAANSVTTAKIDALAVDSTKLAADSVTVSKIANTSITQAKLNLSSPSAGTDAATKSYVDAIASGLSLKAEVRVATTAAGALATDFENGDSIDGITLATSDRILIKDQATASQNGIYVVQASGAPVRASDADTAAELPDGTFCFVKEGSVNSGFGFVLLQGVTTLGTDPLNFTQFNSVGSGANTALSNLVPTAINQDLVFAPGNFARLKTDDDSTATGDMEIRTGNSSASTSGYIEIFTGQSDNNLNTGYAYMYTGSASGTGVSGAVTIYSGNSASGQTGPVDVFSGSSAGQTGNVNVGSGDSSSTDTGHVNIYSGGASADSGDIKLEIGAAGGVPGKIVFVDTSEGTAGHIWTSTDTMGSGAWAAPAAAPTFAKQTFVLSSGDITNQYVALSNTPIANSVNLIIQGGIPTLEGASYDYSISTTHVNFLNDIATGGPSALVAGDIIQVAYSY